MTGLLSRYLGTAPFPRHLPTIRRYLSTGPSSKYNVGHRETRADQVPNTPGHPSELHINVSGEYITPGDYVNSVCRKHQIAFPNIMRGLREARLPENPCKLMVVAAERHCFDLSSMKYFDKSEHPFAKSMLDIYIARKKQPLWLSTFSMAVASPFPCRMARKRIQHAFRDALAAHGYDREGRRIATDDSGVISELYGSVRITCGDPKAACNIKFADLLEQVNKIVSAVEVALARDKNGRHIHGMGTPQRNKKPQSGPSSNWTNRKTTNSQSNSNRGRQSVYNR
ncbi:hypothetical protein M426DRAFT_23283 [Hypoxylon sp. CI-4A]|nr:hypothetical protein M426DRAFT_23283 [Hypoxylon sp. CI-4A]